MEAMLRALSNDPTLGFCLDGIGQKNKKKKKKRKSPSSSSSFSSNRHEKRQKTRKTPSSPSPSHSPSGFEFGNIQSHNNTNLPIIEQEERNNNEFEPVRVQALTIPSEAPPPQTSSRPLGSWGNGNNINNPSSSSSPSPPPQINPPTQSQITTNNNNPQLDEESQQLLVQLNQAMTQHRRRRAFPPGGGEEPLVGRPSRTRDFIGASDTCIASAYIGRYPDNLAKEIELDEAREMLERRTNNNNGDTSSLDWAECALCDEEQSRMVGTDRLSAPFRAIAALELDLCGEVTHETAARKILRARQNLIEKPLSEELDIEDQISGNTNLSSRPRRNFVPWTITMIKKHYGWGKWIGIGHHDDRRLLLEQRLRHCKEVIRELELEQNLKESRSGDWRVVDSHSIRGWATLVTIQDKLAAEFKKCKEHERVYRGLDSEDSAAGRAAAAAGWTRKSAKTNARIALAGPALQSPFKFSGDV